MKYKLPLKWKKSYLITVAPKSAVFTLHCVLKTSAVLGQNAYSQALFP